MPIPQLSRKTQSSKSWRRKKKKYYISHSDYKRKKGRSGKKKNAGWFKGSDGKWHKRKGNESLKDKLDTKPRDEIIWQDDEK